MPQLMTYLGHRSLRSKLKKKTFEQVFLTSKWNSLSLPISKANFTHQTLNPPENSTSVSKPFLHNMHSPKRKSSKFALFCQITGSICYRFPHPLIFHNSSTVSENASHADVLFSVLFANLSIIVYSGLLVFSLSFTILFFLIGQIFHNLFRLCQGGRDYGSFAPSHYLLCLRPHYSVGMMIVLEANVEHCVLNVVCFCTVMVWGWCWWQSRSQW